MDNQSFTDCMIDLETLSITSNAVIIDIGAVKFNVNNDKKEQSPPTIRLIPDIDEQLRLGLNVDKKTLLWWSELGGIPEKMFNSIHSIEGILFSLHRFLKSVDRVWCRGASFDFALIRNLSEKSGCSAKLWKKSQERDSRTILKQFPKLDEGDIGSNKNKKHNALNDAEEQAESLRSARKKLGIYLK